MKGLHAVISILDDVYYPVVEALWDELEAACGLKAIRLTPIPHFSWQVAEDYDFDGLQARLEEIAADSKPFTVRTAGLGIFTGETPVIYVSMPKDPELCAFHDRVWQETKDFARGLSLNYSPQSWVPHITLANRDVDGQNLSCATDLLAERSFAWELRIDNLAVVHQEPEQVGRLKCKFVFGG